MVDRLFVVDIRCVDIRFCDEQKADALEAVGSHGIEKWSLSLAVRDSDVGSGANKRLHVSTIGSRSSPVEWGSAPDVLEVQLRAEFRISQHFLEI